MTCHTPIIGRWMHRWKYGYIVTITVVPFDDYDIPSPEDAYKADRQKRTCEACGKKEWVEL